jgi:arabinogalactan oligomer/maltooligosaccharide transport system permease protein
MKALTLEIITRSLGEVGSTVVYVLVAAVIIEVALYLLLTRVFRSKYAIPAMLLAPAIIGLLGLIVVPIGWEVWISFTNMSLRHFRDPEFIALGNFVRVFTDPILQQARFFPVFLNTVLWTVINLIFHVSGGMALALLLNRKMRFKGLYRTLLVFPWAIPQVIAVLAWRNEFHFQYGFVNTTLQSISLPPIRWMDAPLANFAAACLVNIWLGIPFMMVIILGGLQSISREFYEAAEIDGASAWHQFRYITLPMLRPVLTPAVILGTIWTFNNFNVPYLINQRELETTDILVTALFRAAFEYNRYGFSAAFALVIFVILFVFSVFYIRVTGGLRSMYE